MQLSTCTHGPKSAFEFTDPFWQNQPALLAATFCEGSKRPTEIWQYILCPNSGRKRLLLYLFPRISLPLSEDMHQSRITVVWSWNRLVEFGCTFEPPYDDMGSKVLQIHIKRESEVLNVGNALSSSLQSVFLLTRKLACSSTAGFHYDCSFANCRTPLLRPAISTESTQNSTSDSSVNAEVLKRQ